MIANCPQCAMSLSLDDDRLPTEPFNVLCPRCRQSVTVVPPPRQEPKLPEGTTADDLVSDEPARKDPVRALAETLMAAMNQSKPRGGDLSGIWQRRRVVLCLDDASHRETIRNALDSTHYEIFSADFSPEAIEILHESKAEVIILSPTFDSEHQGGGAMMHYVNTLTPQVRRRTYVVLVSPQVRTLDTYLAFANGVNLTVHPDDMASIQAIFERSVRDFNEIYRPLNKATSTVPF